MIDTTKPLVDFPNFTLICGIGNYAEGTACLLSYTVARKRFLASEKLNGATDQYNYAGPNIRSLSIAINDKPWWKDDAERTVKLQPLAESILAATTSPELERKRAYRCADVAVREFAAEAFDYASKKNPQLKEWADKLRACEPIVDAETARAAEKVAREGLVAAAAYTAAARAARAAFAATAADAADAAYAADAADAATAATAVKNRDRCIKLLHELCEMK